MAGGKVASEIELGSSQDTQKEKRRQLRGTCDKCQIKKIKCDSAQMPGNSCTNCKLFEIPCSHDMPHHHMKTEMQQAAYINILEERIKKLEDYIRKMHPGEDVDRIITMPPHTPKPSFDISCEVEATTGSSSFLEYPVLKFICPSVRKEDLSNISEEDDLAHLALAEDMKRLSMDADAGVLSDERFFGQASVFMFARHVSIVRAELSGKHGDLDPQRYMRHIYWNIRPWELAYITSSESSYIYPDDDLLRSLVHLYFEKTNSLLPVLHQPTFMKSLMRGQHHWDPSFGMTVLLVCALGARYSQDPRVQTPGTPDEPYGLSAGWNYFCQVPIHRKSMLFKSNVYDLQYYCIRLASQYLLGTSMPNSGWDLVGIGLRYALEQGAHRWKGQNQTPSVEDEMRTRAFWAIFCLDLISSSFLGRPYSSPRETFDVEYPIECDDKYWETGDPQTAFRQPEGKPCSITGFVYFIKLCEILGSALRTLYTNKKARILSGYVGPEWEGRMVAALNSSMNEWKDALPDYLHWDPERPDPLFFHQSVNLHATYHYIQMQVHRPYLGMKAGPLTFTSFAMCKNAARSCAHILETGMTRGLRILPTTVAAAFTAGILMVFAIQTAKCTKAGFVSPPDDKIALRRSLDVLRECERRWHSAGRLCDMLSAVGSITERLCELPLGCKRGRELFETEDTAQLTLPSTVAYGQIPISSTVGYGQMPFFDKDLPSSTFDADRDMGVAWDVHALLLAEMGYPAANFRQTTDNSYDSNAHENAYPVNVAPNNGNAQLDSTSGDLLAAWSEILTTTSGFDEWNSYLAAMGQP